MRVTAKFEWERKEDDEIDIPLAEIPANVLAVVRRAVPGAVVKRAEVEIEEFRGREQVVFEVTVEKGGHEIEVEVTPQGERVEVEREE